MYAPANWRQVAYRSWTSLATAIATRPRRPKADFMAAGRRPICWMAGGGEESLTKIGRDSMDLEEDEVVGGKVAADI